MRTTITRIQAASLLLVPALLLSGCGQSNEGLLLPLMDSSAVSVTEVPGGSTSPTSSSDVGGHNVTIPSGPVTQGPTPGGDFTGITFTGSSPELSGFISIIVAGSSTDAADVGNALVGVLNGSGQIAGATVISSQQASGASDTQLLNLEIVTGSPMTVTELANLILQLFGTSVPGGTVTLEPVPQGEGKSTTFRVVIQITFTTPSSVLLGVGVTTEENYDDAAPVLGGILDGTNFAPTGSTVETVTNLFEGTGAPKADFLFVVDNSGSMAQEQTAVANVATKFFDKINSTSTDFKIGVITTDSSSIRSPGFSNVKTEFTSAINAGTSGSGTESGLHFALKSLGSGQSLATAGYPRAGSSLTVVILSDEGDHYACYNGGSTQSGAVPCKNGTNLNTSSNLFTQNGLRVYTIIGLNGGAPGTCTGNGTSATNANNAWPAYYQVSQATGGASSSICSNDFSSFLTIVATQGIAAGSSYQLTKTPISSSLVVMVNGTQVQKSATNGYTYDSVNNALIFSGSAIPPAASAISVSFSYYVENQQSGLGAYLAGAAGGRGRLVLIGVTLVALAGLAAIMLMRGRSRRRVAPGVDLED